MTDERKLELLLDALVRMVSLRACEPGEKSHALWAYTDKTFNLVKEIIRKPS